MGAFPLHGFAPVATRSRPGRDFRLRQGLRRDRAPWQAGGKAGWGSPEMPVPGIPRNSEFPLKGGWKCLSPGIPVMVARENLRKRFLCFFDEIKSVTQQRDYDLGNVQPNFGPFPSVKFTMLIPSCVIRRQFINSIY